MKRPLFRRVAGLVDAHNVLDGRSAHGAVGPAVLQLHPAGVAQAQVAALVEDGVRCGVKTYQAMRVVHWLRTSW